MRRLEIRDLQPIFEENEPGPLPREGISDKRITIEHPLFQARSHIISLGGLLVLRGMSKTTRDLELVSHESPPPIMLSLYIDGSVQGTWPASGVTVESAPGMHGIAFSPEPGFRFRLAAGVPHEIFEVNISQGYLRQLAERYPEIVEGPLTPILKNRPFSSYARPGVLPPEAAGIAARILASEDHGPARRAYIEACVTELLAPDRAPARDPPAALRPRQIQRMHEARAELLARIKDPPTLSELAHRVGTNEFSLKKDFKTVFGRPVFEELFEHRMKIARRMLLETDAGIEEIAEEVGYSSASHFTSAFRRRHGFPPGKLRGRARA